ncbi:MAG: lipopolysaccharide biosynthesis protein [Nibricoccus sp.]
MKLLSSIRNRFGRLSNRSKAIGKFFATSLAARGIGISCQLMQVPIAIGALGSESFGLWMTLTSIGTMITFADFGLGQGAQNKLSEAFAAGDDRLARELFGGVMVLLAGIGLLLAVLTWSLVPRLNVAALFNLANPITRDQAPLAVVLTLLLFCANFPFSLAQRLAYGRQLGWMHNTAQALGSVGALGGVLLATHFHLGLAAFILVAQLPLVLANVGLLVLQLAQLRWLDFRILRCRWTTLQNFFGLGVCFGIQQVQLVLLTALPQVIISGALGAAAVTPYNLAQRLFNLFAIVQNALMLPLWPAYTDAKAHGDFKWIRRTLTFSLGATLLLAIAPMGVGAFFARPVLELWVGHGATLPSDALLWLLFLWNALVFLQQAIGYMLAGMSEVRRLTIYAVVSTAACASLMVLLVQRYGQEGVVVGMILGFMPYLLFGNIAEALRFFRQHHAEPAVGSIIGETPPATS